MTFACRICENREDNLIHTAREMMFGTRDEFDYLECGACGTIQILELPDLSRYYPDNYLSFGSRVVMAETLNRRIAARSAGKYFASGKSFIGKFIVGRKPWIGDHYPVSMRDFPLKIDFNSRILDFGCGVGNLLQSLYYFGFRNLTGADAFIKSDIFYPTGVKIFKCSLDELEPYFDLIMLHHSFEHLANPLGSLQQIHRLLANDSFCLIRIPVVNYAWEKYGTDWVQLDPPRHLFLYTEKSFRYLADKAGLKMEKVIYDSGAFQFWGSEQYRNNLPLMDARSYWTDPSDETFTSEQISQWQTEAAELNAAGKGDMACFYLRKS